MRDKSANEKLITAAYDGDIDGIKKAVQSGADLSYLDDQSFSALHRAAFDQVDPDVVDVLLVAGADIEQKSGDANRTALMLAASVGNTGVCQRLILKGADYQVRDSFGWNALHLAIRSKKFETVEAILSNAHGIEYEAPNDRDGAIWLSQSYQLDDVVVLLKRQLDFESLNKVIEKEHHELSGMVF